MFVKESGEEEGSGVEREFNREWINVVLPWEC
jgi:hypothetical protein